MSEKKSEETFKITDSVGRVWTLRRVPQHLFLLFGQLPGEMTAIAAKAMETGDEAALGEEMLKTMSPEQLKNSVFFMREAVRFACVNPKIVLTPNNENEISAFDVSEQDFSLLFSSAMKGGEQAKTLSNFRPKSRRAA